MDRPVEPSSNAIGDDVPCIYCGYNLRGLRSTLCPECGRHVLPSVAEFELQRRYPGLSGLGRTTLVELRWGVLLVLLGFAVMWFLAWGEEAQPRGWRAISKQGLYLGCCAWTCMFWGLWKMAIPLSTPPSSRSPGPRVVMRVFIILAVLAPGWMFLDYALFRWQVRRFATLSEVMAVVGFLASALCIGFCSIQAAQCAAIANRTVVAGLAWAVGFMHGLAYLVFVLLTLPGSALGNRSLNTLVALPTPLGSPIAIPAGWFGILYRADWWRRASEGIGVILIGYAILQLAAVYVLIATAIMLFRARALSQGSISSAAAQSQKTAASSRP
jgi:hypothetical protein